MENYGFSELDQELLNRIEEAWSSLIDQLPEEVADMYWSHFTRRISWWKSYIDPESNNGDWRLYVVTDEGANPVNPLAIVDLTDAHKSKDPSMKLLDIDLEPGIFPTWEDDIDQEMIYRVIRVIGYSIRSAMDLAKRNGVKKFKIYGRSDEFIGLFDTLIATAQKWVNCKVYRQQRWLVIES